MTDIAIQTTNLTKSFKDTDVLQGVHLQARRGQIFVTGAHIPVGAPGHTAGRAARPNSASNSV